MHDDDHYSLFAPIIVVVRVIINILLGYTLKSQREEFSSNSIYLLEFQLECVIKVKCMEREEERFMKKNLF